MAVSGIDLRQGARLRNNVAVRPFWVAGPDRQACLTEGVMASLSWVAGQSFQLLKLLSP